MVNQSLESETTTAPAVIPASDLEEMFEKSIPCGGRGYPKLLPCPGERPAILQRVRGGCEHPMGPHHFKCLDCYVSWRNDTQAKINRNGYIRCILCKQTFPTIDSFSRYGPL